MRLAGLTTHLSPVLHGWTRVVRCSSSSQLCVWVASSGWFFYWKVSAAAPVLTKIQPAMNKLGTVTEWMTQYRRDVRMSTKGLSPVEMRLVAVYLETFQTFNKFHKRSI